MLEGRGAGEVQQLMSRLQHSSSARAGSPDLWVQSAQLVWKIKQQASESRFAPMAADFTEYDAAAAHVVIERFEKIVARNGWWTAERIYKLTSMEKDIVRLALRVKMKSETFRGTMNAAALARWFECSERAIQLAIKRLEEIELLKVDREFRAIVSLRINRWFFDAERPRRVDRQPGGMATMTPQKIREIRRRKARQAADRFEAGRELRTAADAPLEACQAVQELAGRAIGGDSAVTARFLAERARRAAEPCLETKKTSDLISKSLSSERTPFPLFGAPAAAAAGAASPQPPLNGQKEALRSFGPDSPERPRPIPEGGGPHGSAKRTNDIERRRQRKQGIKSHRREVLEPVTAGAELQERAERAFHGPEPPS